MAATVMLLGLFHLQGVVLRVLQGTCANRISNRYRTLLGKNGKGARSGGFRLRVKDRRQEYGGGWVEPPRPLGSLKRVHQAGRGP